MPTQSSSNQLDPEVTYEENQAPNWLGGEVAVGVGIDNNPPNPYATGTDALGGMHVAVAEDSSLFNDIPNPSKDIIALFAFDYIYTTSPNITYQGNGKSYPRNEVLSWLITTAASKDPRITRAIADGVDNKNIVKLIEEVFLLGTDNEGNNLSTEKLDALLQAMEAELKKDNISRANLPDLNVQITNAEKIAAERLANARIMAARKVNVINPIVDRVLAGMPSSSAFSQSVHLVDLEIAVDQAVSKIVAAKSSDSQVAKKIVAQTLAHYPQLNRGEVALALASSLEIYVTPKIIKLNVEAQGIARALQNQGYGHQDASEIAETIVYHTDPHPLIKGSLSSFKQPNYREIWKKWGKSDLQAEQSQRKFEQLRAEGYSAITAVVEAGRANDSKFTKIFGDIPVYSQPAAEKAYQQLQSNIQDIDRSRSPAIPIGRNHKVIVASMKMGESIASRDEINSMLRTAELSPKLRKVLTMSDKAWNQFVKTGAIPYNRIAQLKQMREDFFTIRETQKMSVGNSALGKIRGALRSENLFNLVGGVGKQFTSKSGLTIITDQHSLNSALQNANAADLKRLEKELGTVLTGTETDLERHKFYDSLRRSGQLSRWARPSVILVKSDSDNVEMVLIETTNRGNIVYHGPLGWARTQMADWTTAAEVYLAEGSNNLAMADGFRGRIGGWISTGLDKLGVKGAIGGFLGDMKSKLLSSGGLGKIAEKAAGLVAPLRAAMAIKGVLNALGLSDRRLVQIIIAAPVAGLIFILNPIIAFASGALKLLGIGAAKTGAAAGEVIRNASGTTTVTGTAAGGGGSSFGGTAVSIVNAPVYAVTITAVAGIFTMHQLSAAFVLPPYGTDSGELFLPDYATEFTCDGYTQDTLPEGYPTGKPFDGTHSVTVCPGLYPNNTEFAGQAHGNSVDFSMDGIAVKSTLEGKVIAAEESSQGYGWHVIIESENKKFYIILAHLEEGSITVKRGDAVHVGTVVGTSNSSGRSTGPHLHYELKTRDQSYGNLSIWCGISFGTECYVGANP